jgi:hypothetical protein
MPQVIWQPQPGPQTLMLMCPIREIVYGGARGGGKTDGTLGHWIKHHALHGGMAQGIFFRRRYKQLDRVVRRGKELFCSPLLRDPAVFLSSQTLYKFVWPDGAELLLRHLERHDSWEEYQGHEYNWMCFEELTQWPTPDLMDKMRASNRDSRGVPCWMIATCNPGGSGHSWVKERYIMRAKPGEPFQLSAFNEGSGVRIDRLAVFIPARVWDNPALLNSQPDYIDNLYLSGPAWLVRAWLEGDWSVAAGGFLLEVWDPRKHIVEPFKIPITWPRWRAMDWGFSRPYSIGWYAMDPDTKRIFRYREQYGYGGRANVGARQEASSVAIKVLQKESIEKKAGIVFNKNPADASIWHGIGTETTIAKIFRENGVKWVPAMMGPGSRKSGAQVVIDALRRNQFAVWSTCEHFLRTVPDVPADPDDLEDVDTESEDHAWDELRMSLVSRHRAEKQVQEEKEPAPFTGAWVEKHGRQRPSTRH